MLYLCSTFGRLPSTFRAPVETSVNNLHGGRTCRQHQFTFRASTVLTINLHQLFVRPGISCQLSVRPVDFPLSFLVSARPVNVVPLPSITLYFKQFYRVSYPKLMKYSPMILVISITQ